MKSWLTWLQDIYVGFTVKDIVSVGIFVLVSRRSKLGTLILQVYNP